MRTHIIIDLLYDFIDGSLACQEGEKAVANTIKYINDNPADKVLYICDNHPANHCSFTENGGIWVSHCVQGSRGCEIHKDFYEKIDSPTNRPTAANTFYKGQDFSLEEYSGYKAKNTKGELLKDICTKEVVASGVATEYCVKNTLLDLHNDGFELWVIEDNLSYVEYDGHITTLEELSKIMTIIK